MPKPITDIIGKEAFKEILINNDIIRVLFCSLAGEAIWSINMQKPLTPHKVNGELDFTDVVRYLKDGVANYASNEFMENRLLEMEKW